MDLLLARLRHLDMESMISNTRPRTEVKLITEFASAGVKFVSSPNRLEAVHHAAAVKLHDCIVPFSEGKPVLQEGGVYLGCWLESTGTINSEILSRFIPSVAQASFEQFADEQREDGLMPYKLTATGPVFRQIQLVTPLARSAWNHYKRNGKDREFLRKMYDSLSRYDDWLATYRNTRGSGCVEAFCTFDTGHDLSPRFWHVPNTPHLGDPAHFHSDSPVLPFLAPDLTANVYCTRKYLSFMAKELGEPEYILHSWAIKAEQTRQALMTYCYDELDAFFYDLDRHGQFVRVQSDVLLRVLACEVGDDEFFAESLRRYLLHTRKFFAKYPLTSIAMDDPRFDPSSQYNTWAGTTNFLSLIRAPHAFEYHGRYVELSWLMQPIMSAISRMTRFSQCISPWTGEEGFTELYSPAILCVLDFVERLCGVFPTANGQLWFTGLLPYPMDHGDQPGEQTAYSRLIDGSKYELVNTREQSCIFRDEQLQYRLPYGIRVVTDRTGHLQSLIGMVVGQVEGTLWYDGLEIPFCIAGNEVLQYVDGGLKSIAQPGIIPISY